MLHRGRWQWSQAVADTAQHLCPACEHIRDGVPAGELTLSGEFFRAHREDVLHLVRNTESNARAEHPLERIIDTRDQGNGVVVTFTDAHLAHGVGEALHRAYRGELDSRYTDEGDLLRVTWHR